MNRARSALSVAGLLLLAGGIVFLSRTTAGYLDVVAPFVSRGEPGEWVHARTFGLHVDKSHLARVIRVERYGKVEERTTSGVWVIVQVQAVALREPASIGRFSLATSDGKRYDHTERVRLPATITQLLGKPMQPETPVSGILIFEVPVNRIAQLELTAGELAYSHLDSEVRVPLKWGDAGPSIRDMIDFGS